jgi:hypothetical protein
MKSVVRVDGGGTGIAIDVGRDRGDDGWDDSHAMVGGLLLSTTVGGVMPAIVVGVVFMVGSDVSEGFLVLWEIVQVVFFL